MVVLVHGAVLLHLLLQVVDLDVPVHKLGLETTLLLDCLDELVDLLILFLERSLLLLGLRLELRHHFVPVTGETF
jgi:hypothetical protein